MSTYEHAGASLALVDSRCDCEVWDAEAEQLLTPPVAVAAAVTAPADAAFRLLLLQLLDLVAHELQQLRREHPAAGVGQRARAHVFVGFERREQRVRRGKGRSARCRGRGGNGRRQLLGLQQARRKLRVQIDQRQFVGVRWQLRHAVRCRRRTSHVRRRRGARAQRASRRFRGARVLLCIWLVVADGLTRTRTGHERLLSGLVV